MDATLANVKKKKITPQSKKFPGRKKEMIKNHAGGAVFKIDSFSQIKRFLILGISSNTYYADKKVVAKENADCIKKFLKKESFESVILLVDEIVRVSSEGLAISNDPALFALAMCGSPKYNKDSASRSYALQNLNSVVRIFPHLTAFLEYSKSLERGWGSAFKRAIGNWYSEKSTDHLAYQMAKYRQRDGWTHRDVLLKSSPVTTDPEMESIFRWGVGATREAREVTRNDVTIRYPEVSNVLPDIIIGYERAKSLTTAKEAVKLIKGFSLTHEMLPKDMLAHKSVWKELANNMPMRATLWNLGRLSSHGLLAPMGELTEIIVDRMANQEYIKKSRLHPITILIALTAYKKGKGIKGNLSWDVNQDIVAALEDAFELSFGNVVPTNKRILLALDISGSMAGFWGNATTVGLSPAEISTAMALVTKRVEKKSYIMGFSTDFIDLGITKNDSFSSSMKKTFNLTFGRTDCALPMIWGMQNNIAFDACVVYTDNETWYGNIHPFEALKQYRKKMGIDTKLIVCATSTTNFSIADPKDPGMLDCCGFSADTPNVISNFIKGEL